ncbi:MAG: ABC transporter permease [Bauldia sp.]|nr:ABC transporter permease [Bauldia sp.]
MRLFPAGRRFGRRVAETGPGPIVPANSIAGNALMIVVAIMSFLACITVGAVTLVRDAAHDWQQDVLREVTVQIVPLDGADIEAGTARALAILRQTPGIGSATALSTAQNETLLEPWLGGLDMSELPIPRLIVVEVADAAAIDFAALGAQIAAEVPGAVLDDHRMWTDRLRSMANVTVLVGFAVLLLVFAATVLSVVFATRGAMAGNQGIVSVLHFVGAEDGFVAGEFQRHFLILGLKGGLAGAAAAAVLFALLGLAMTMLRSSPEGAQVSALFGSFAVGPTGYFGALGVAFAIAVLTAITSRITVFRYLGEVK